MRAWLIRRRFARRLAITVLVVVVVSIVAGVVSEARRTQAAWGTIVDVVAVDTDVGLGESVEIDDLSLIRRPVAFVAPDALRKVPIVADVAVRSLRAGEVVTSRDLRSTRDAITLPAGHRAVSFPLDATIPHLESGDLVDLHLVDDRFGRQQDVAPGRAVVPALVVEVTDVAVVLAVAAEDVGGVAATHTTGRVVIALR